ncbi:hypothetical protein SDC9_72514 [bioreactor metagenome]|uniref:Uncharacterized protein n=1 Tax=bioreactor metagenome TaxID=1076179 RepID=A0A644YHQ3_9ZZZZ
MLVESDVVIAHGVQHRPGRLIAQNGGVALHKGVQVFFRKEIAGDALNLVRRAAVQSGDSDAAGDVGRDGGNKGLLAGEHLTQNGDALLENGGAGRVDHAVEEGVDLLALDSLQIIAHRHIEHKPVRVAQAVYMSQHFAGAPRLHVFLECLRNIQLRGPLAVVALVVCQNAGLVNAGGQFRAVHLLNGL